MVGGGRVAVAKYSYFGGDQRYDSSSRRGRECEMRERECNPPSDQSLIGKVTYCQTRRWRNWDSKGYCFNYLKVF
jgi:hypothetical protein